MAQTDRIAQDLDSNLYVVAGAGAGKTTALVNRICALVASGKFPIERIAAITFTRAAASELRYRIMEELERRAADGQCNEQERARMRAALNGIQDASFRTIDSFCLSILQDHQARANVAPITEAGSDELESERRFSDDWRRWLNRNLDAHSSEGLPEMVSRAARLGMADPLGKLRKIARELHQSKYPMYAGKEIEAPEQGVPYAEVLKRLAPLASSLRDAVDNQYHGPQDDKLLKHIREKALPLIGQLVEAGDDAEESDYLLGSAGKLTTNLGDKSNWAQVAAHGAGDVGKPGVLNVLRMAEELVQGERNYRLILLTSELLQELLKFARACVEERRLNGTPEFTDTMHWTLEMLRSEPDVRAALKREHGTILVDEYQDTDSLQIELVKLITAQGGSGRPQEGALFVVGDPKQSIYSFRGASPQTMEDSQKLFNMAQDKVALGINYRSTPAIVNWVNNLFANWFGSPEGGGIGDVVMEAASQECPESAVQVSGMNYRGIGIKSFVVRGGRMDALAEGLGAEEGHVRLIARTRSGVMLAVDPQERAGFTYMDAQGVVEALRGARRALVHRFDGREALSGARLLNLNSKADKTDRNILKSEVEKFRAEEIAELAVKVGRGGFQVRDGRSKRQSKPGDLCILVRKHSMLPEIEQALEEYGVDYAVHGKTELFAGGTVNGVVNLLDALRDPAAQMALAGALKSELFNCSDADLLNWQQAGGKFDYTATPDGAAAAAAPGVARAMQRILELHRLSRSETVPGLLEQIIRGSRLRAATVVTRTAPEQDLHKLEMLVECAMRLHESGRSGLAEFVEWCLEMRASELKINSPTGRGANSAQVVSVMTVHAAKGLEFPIVAVLPATAGGEADAVLSAGSVRIADGFESTDYQTEKEMDKQAQAQEEVRVMYVAMTRARDHLFVGLHRAAPRESESSAVRRLETHIPENTPNRFMADAPQAQMAPPPAPPGRAAAPPPKARDADEWASELKQVIERSSKPAVLTASGLKRHGIEEERGGDEASEEGEPIRHYGDDTGMLIGSAVHAVLEEIPMDADEQAIRDAVDRNLDSDELKGHADSIAGMVAATLKEPLMRRAAASPRCLRELPLICALPSGETLNCIVDLAFEDADGNWVVVDYKTDAVGEGGAGAVAERYSQQMAAYAYALKRITGKQVAEVCLLLCREAAAGRAAVVGVDVLDKLEQAVSGQRGAQA